MKCMAEAGLSPCEHLVVTELGIEKKHDLVLAEADIERTERAAREKLNISQPRET